MSTQRLTNQFPASHTHQTQPGLTGALDAAGEHLRLALESLEDAVVNRLRLTAGIARADQEVVGVAEYTPQVELDDIHSLLVGRITRDLSEQLLGAHQLRTPVGALYRPCSAM